MNKENLAILASYLERLPIDYQEFDMGTFFDGRAAHSYIKGNETKCGTIACAAGHGPAAGLHLTWQQMESRESFTGPWIFYIETIFGLEWGELNCNWVFGAQWADFDNTHRGAAARIRFLLDDDKAIPEGFDNDFGNNTLQDYPSSYEEYLV